MNSEMLTIEDILSKTTDLPSLPAATLAVMRETDSPNATAQSVAKHLALDAGLAVRVLRLANSAYYGLPRQVKDVPEAVVVLGMRSVRNLALVASTFPWMNRPYSGYGLGPTEMWRHSFGVAVATELIAIRTNVASSEHAFTCGLLHNLGKTALSVWLENKIEALVGFAQEHHLPFDALERRVLGFDHCDVGAHLGEQWNLPKSIVDVMQFHHRPDDCREPIPLVDCVHLADYVTASLGIGLGGDGLCYEFSRHTLERLRLAPVDIDKLASDFLDVHEKYQALFEGVAA